MKKNCAAGVKRERASESITAVRGLDVSERALRRTTGVGCLTSWEQEHPGKNHEGNMAVNDGPMTGVREVRGRILISGQRFICLALPHVHVVAMGKGGRDESQSRSACNGSQGRIRERLHGRTVVIRPWVDVCSSAEYSLEVLREASRASRRLFYSEVGLDGAVDPRSSELEAEDR